MATAGLGHKLALMGSFALLSACSVVGVRSGTEQPRYSVIAVLGDDLEIRRYGPRIAAETTVDGHDDAARNQAFRRLAGYIFGGNHARGDIAMTAPVDIAMTAPVETTLTAPVETTLTAPVETTLTAPVDIAMTTPVETTVTAPVERADTAGRTVMRFFMPADHTMDSLPTPDDSRVTLRMVAEETQAVLRFSGTRDAEAIAAHQDELIARLAPSPWVVRGAPTAYLYDPPWTLPFLRRNEVAVAVTPRQTAP